jgi:nitrogen regulatory protein P-II 2
MNTQMLALVTIIAEPVLEESLTRELLRLGATGFTVCSIRGRGSRGLRTGDIPGDGVRIETLVSADVADAILERAAASWFPDYSVVAWKSTVEVVRGDKYLHR